MDQSNAVQTAVSMFQNLKQNFSNAINNFTNGVGNTVNNVEKGVGNAFQGIEQKLTPQLTDITSAIAPIVSDYENVKNVADTFSNLVSQVPSLAQEAYKQIAPPPISINQSIQNTLQGKDPWGNQKPFIPFDPTTWGAPIPRVDISSRFQQTPLGQLAAQNPVTNFLANTAIGIPESIINAPSDIQRGIQQTSADVQSGDITKPGVVLSDIGKVGLPVLTLATLPFGGEAITQGAKEGVLQAAKEGILTGAKFGGGFGLLQGLEGNRNVTDPVEYATNIVKQTGVGTVFGAGLGGLTQGGSAILGKLGTKLLPFGDTKGIQADAVDGLDKMMPQIQQNRIKYDDPKYMADTLLAQKDWNSFLDAHPEINNHGDQYAELAKGPDPLRTMNGYIGYISTDRGTIPLDPQQENAVLDKRVIDQWTGNNGDQELAIVRRDPNNLTSYDVIDRHHGIPAARAIGLDKIPAIILHKDAPLLSDVYAALKDGTVDPVNITGGFPLDELAAGQKELQGLQGGKKTLTPEDIQSIAPELATDKGKAQVNGVLDRATKAQPALDTQFKDIAANVGLDPNTDFESRVKSPDGFVKKVAQHRFDGTDDYSMRDVNDPYGGRFIADTPAQKGQIISQINKMDQDGQLKILKQEQVTKDTYSAYHIDFIQNGVKGEIQIHDPNSYLESVVNHEIRAQAGENPPPALKEERDINAQVAEQMPPELAQPLAKAEETAQAKGVESPLGVNAKEGQVAPEPTGLSPDVQRTLENAPVTTTRGRNTGGENPLNNLRPNYKPADTDIQNLIRQYTGQYAYETNQAAKESIPLTKYWETQPKADRLSFMQKMQSGIAQDNPAEQALADHYKSKFDNTYEIGSQVKPDLAYKDDYFTKSGIWANKDEAQAFYNKFIQAKMAGTPGSFKDLTFPTIADGVKAGLTLKETNPETIYLNNYLQVRKAQIMSDFQQTAQARGYDMNAVQGIIDKYMDPGFGGSNLYKDIRSVNNVLNSIDLGLSGFHIAGTTINASVSKLSLGLNQLLTGHPIEALGSVLRAPTAALEYVFRGNQIIKEAERGNLTPDVQNIIDAGGRITPQADYKGSGLEGAIRTTIDDFNNGRVAGAVVKAPFRVVGGALNTVAKPIMEYWVPRLKNGALADLIETNLKNLPEGATPEEIQAVKAEASDSIDNRFGQLVQDNLFWNKAVKDTLGLAMRSPGWNIGTGRELGLGARDLLDVNRLLSGRGFSDRAAYTLTLPVVTGLLGGVYQYLHTGNWPQSVTDYFYPQTGQTDPNTGKEERVGFPTYMKDVYSFFTNPGQTILNKLSPIGSDIKTQIQGVDYRGKPIFDPTADFGTQARQRVAQEIMGHLPFSIQSGTNRINPTTASTLESIMGINKAPGSVTGGYYDKKSEIYATLKPNEKQIMDYLTLSSQMGGPSGKDKASVLLKNEWAINDMKQIQFAGNPKDLLWSKPVDQIKAYLAYQLETDSKLRAQILVENPWIPSFSKQYSDQVSQSVQAAKQKQATQQQGLYAQIGNVLGVYNQPPTTPSTDFVQRAPTPQSQLTPQQVQIAAAYTALPQGSIQRRQILAQNPWLINYWNANNQYYAQNPTQASGPLADYLKSQGINPNIQPTSTSGFISGQRRSISSRLSVRGGTSGGGGTSSAKIKGIPTSTALGKMLVGNTLAKGKMVANLAATHKAISQAKAKAPKVSFGGGVKGALRGLTAKVGTAKIKQPKPQVYKNPPLKKVSLSSLGRGQHSPRYGKYEYI